jgi:UDP-GlcNAc3NAcA epimerase
MKLVTIVGARPQFVKAATVSRAIAKYNKDTDNTKCHIEELIIHTGQHYDTNMSDVFFEQMEISKPDYNLGIGGGMHGLMTGRQLEKIEEVLLKEKPDCVLVYGDTNSTLAGALAAIKLHISVAHVEAGLRSYNRRMPEEVNRVLTDHISTYLFSPTENALNNLLSEGIPRENIFVVGDVMYDASLFYKSRAVKPIWLDDLPVQDGNYLLCTIHRAENTDEPEKIRSIFSGLEKFGFPVILPLHPRTKKLLKGRDVFVPKNIHIVEPVGYLEMVWLESHCKMVATDSGGVQKEAYFHGKPCVVLREETEWVELVEAGANLIAGSDSDLIFKSLKKLVSNYSDFAPLYGSGNSAEQIVDFVRKI